MRFCIVSLTLFLLLLIGCNASKMGSKKGNDIYITYTFINYNGMNYDTMEMSQCIIKNKGFTFIKEPAIMFTDDLHKPDTSYSYYLFHKDYSYGFYKRFDEEEISSINKDSFFLNQFYIKLEKINQNAKPGYAYLNSSNENGLLVNKFYLKKEIDSSYSDTSLFYFDDKLKTVDFSLDKNLDSVYQSKFVKMRALYYNKIADSPNYGTVYRDISISFVPGNFQRKNEFEELVMLFRKYNSGKQ